MWKGWADESTSPPPPLSPLYFSEGEASWAHRYMAESHGWFHSCCQRRGTDVQDDGLGKLAPQDQKSSSALLGLIFTYVKMALLYLRPRSWTGLAEGSFWHAWQSWMEILVQETEQTGRWWSRTTSTSCLYNVWSAVTACTQHQNIVFYYNSEMNLKFSWFKLFFHIGKNGWLLTEIVNLDANVFNTSICEIT